MKTDQQFFFYIIIYNFIYLKQNMDFLIPLKGVRNTIQSTQTNAHLFNKTIGKVFPNQPAGLTNRPMGPPHRKTSLPNHKEVKVRFLQICEQTLSDEVKAALRLPTFDSYEWSDEAVLHLMQTMFIDCGFVEKFQIPLPVLREWLYEVYKHYNLVPFHNFRHCFCVAQMVSGAACLYVIFFK